MRTTTISVEDFELFQDVQIRPRWGWSASFSCNKSKEVWPFSGFGPTPKSKRQYLEGFFPSLDRIVEVVLSMRSEGGRFFIDERGVFIRPEDKYVQIAQFAFKNVTGPL